MIEFGMDVPTYGASDAIEQVQRRTVMAHSDQEARRLLKNAYDVVQVWDSLLDYMDENGTLDDLEVLHKGPISVEWGT
jgi:hypothetical protein